MNAIVNEQTGLEQELEELLSEKDRLLRELDKDPEPVKQRRLDSELDDVLEAIEGVKAEMSRPEDSEDN